ncbi:hypothetical protein [Geobacter pickeringii]|uniref:Uncharacterized protein n=1 Tax=Geobacter pickeringii TaxID=345632 RepID=A0A0B5BG80_9BACT|nr:hypothetical protein [Geobacter pickeringii]AJE04144.1 hypothetical protein GPICK_12955 [Geobacter pickeringii]
MALVETSRVREVLAEQIGVIREFAGKLDSSSDFRVLEADIAEIEGALGALKKELAAIPHRHE